MPALKQFVLPFAVLSESRKEPFSDKAEIAAIFALSELERRNGGLNSKQEKNVYILKVGYPLLLITINDFMYVFDGLNKINYNWKYYEAIQTELKLEEFEVDFRIHEKYVKFLDTYHENFKHTQTKKELYCEGLIADNTLLEELESYYRETTDTTTMYSQPDLLLPVLQETEAIKSVNQIETLQASFKEKTKKLGQLSKLISKTTERYIEGFNFESKAITEETEAKIKAQKEIINPKTEKITLTYKKQVEQIEKSIDKEKQPIEKQKNNIEKNIKKTEKNIEQYSRQVKNQAQKGNKRLEDSLKKKLKKEKQEIDKLQTQHKKIEKQLKELSEQKTNEIDRLKHEFEKKIQIERQPITTLETLRNEKQESFKQKSLKLEELTQPVTENLEQLINNQEKLLTHMKISGLKTNTEQKNNTIIYIPFYIAAYNKTNSETKRYFILSPTWVSSLGFSSKLKGILGRAKIKDLFNERKAISVLGENLRLNATSNVNFKAQIEELSQKNNILDMKTQLRDGLVLLKEEGWFSESDYLTISSAIQNI